MFKCFGISNFLSIFLILLLLNQQGTALEADRTFTLIDPLAYHVNNVGDLDREVVKAFKGKDGKTIAEMTKSGDAHFDVFICVNNAWHAFVLCIPNHINDPLEVMLDIPQDDPFVVPGDVLSWVFELVYENVQLRQYKIKKDFRILHDIKTRINTAYYIGRYMNVTPHALQFAALRAAPHRYNVLLNDCVEFAKEFCRCLLSYCSNYGELESQVYNNISKATASGLSVEQLSRHFRSSAWFGNTALGGLDASAFFSEQNGSLLLVLLISFMLIYPCLVYAFINFFNRENIVFL